MKTLLFLSLAANIGLGVCAYRIHTKGARELQAMTTKYEVMQADRKAAWGRVKSLRSLYDDALFGNWSPMTPFVIAAQQREARLIASAKEQNEWWRNCEKAYAELERQSSNRLAELNAKIQFAKEVKGFTP